MIKMTDTKYFSKEILTGQSLREGSFTCKFILEHVPHSSGIALDERKIATYREFSSVVRPVLQQLSGDSSSAPVSYYLLLQFYNYIFI